MLSFKGLGSVRQFFFLLQFSDTVKLSPLLLFESMSEVKYDMIQIWWAILFSTQAQFTTDWAIWPIRAK